MSSAILYLAIVAIWAGFLIPAWIRRPHASRSGETEFTAEFQSDAEIDVDSSTEADLEGGIHVEVSRHIQVSRHTEAAQHAGSGEHAGSGQHTEAGRRIEISHSEPVRRVAVTHAAGPNQAAPGRLDFEPEYVGDVPEYPESGIRPAARTSAAQPSESRLQMMHSRRRMLTILAGLTALAFGLAGIGLAAWWICVPPTGMLVFYLLLLREIAMADAEMAAKRRQARAARATRQHAREAWAASHPEPTAQIIDISSRVGDQLYDQYADATVRAVGD